MKKTETENGFAFGRLSNEEIFDLLPKLPDLIKEKFGDFPVNVQVFTWDTHYGDVLADGAIIVQARMDAWKAEKRLAVIRKALTECAAEAMKA